MCAWIGKDEGVRGNMQIHSCEDKNIAVECPGRIWEIYEAGCVCVRGWVGEYTWRFLKRLGAKHRGYVHCSCKLFTEANRYKHRY